MPIIERVEDGGCDDARRSNQNVFLERMVEFKTGIQSDL
jgi:hypothetical protein